MRGATAVEDVILIQRLTGMVPHHRGSTTTTAAHLRGGNHTFPKKVTIKLLTPTAEHSTNVAAADIHGTVAQARATVKCL